MLTCKSFSSVTNPGGQEIGTLKLELGQMDLKPDKSKHGDNVEFIKNASKLLLIINYIDDNAYHFTNWNKATSDLHDYFKA